MEAINKNRAKSENEHKMFKGDGLRLVFLTLLYSIQGIGFGYLLITMPVILKKHFTYREIGIISWWSFPLTIKILFAPFVDTYYIKWLGKKRSWIIPTQLLLVIFNFYMSISINQLIEDKRYDEIAVIFSIMILLCAFQDIAIDGWWLTMVHESNQIVFKKLNLN